MFIFNFFLVLSARGGQVSDGPEGIDFRWTPGGREGGVVLGSF